MAEQGVNNGRRRFLTTTTAVVGGAGAIFAAVPFVKSWQPSARAKLAGAPVEVDISKLEAGQRLIEQWRGQPVWIVRRTPEQLAELPKLDPELADPNSLRHPDELTPEWARNTWRSRKPEFLVVVGICTHLGCSPTFRPDLAPADLGAEWKGGFFCPCHGSRFDLAGRVYSGVPAPKNMVVPPYKYLSDTRILVGVGAEAA